MLDPPDTIVVVIEFPSVEPGEAVVVSATAYLAHLECPDRALARLRGEYPADSDVSFRGGLAHRVFARHLQAGPIEAADVAQVCREEIGLAMNQKLTALALRPSKLNALIAEVGDLYETFKRFPTEGFAAAEVFVEVEPVQGVTLRGSIDAVFGSVDAVRLVDWKTGALGAAQHQLAFYSLLWCLDRKSLPELVEAVSVKTGERHAERPTAEAVSATARAVADMVTAQRRALASNGWIERVAGGWCRFCPLLDTCEEGASAARFWGI
jgi:PD-(D/E)XK nuclease superfamily